MNIIYKFHFLNGITEINQLFDDILIILTSTCYIEKDVMMHFFVWNLDLYLSGWNTYYTVQSVSIWTVGTISVLPHIGFETPTVHFNLMVFTVVLKKWKYNISNLVNHRYS